jgi:hypothetical protein
MADVEKLRAIPLPSTREELLARKTMTSRLTLNDYVDQIHIVLWEKGTPYYKLLDAVYDEDAVEGSLAIDNSKAAEMIRAYAEENKIPEVATKKLATLVKALNVVLRRYHMTRQERAVSIGGEAVNNT